MLKFDWNFLFTLINLVVWFLLIKLVLLKPIKRTLDKRKEIIDKQFKDAEDANEQALALKGEYESKIADIDSQSDQIISDAKNSAKAEYAKIIEKAETDVKKLKADAQKQIKAENENAKRAAKEEIASLAMQAAEKVVGANISSQTDSDIFDEFLNESSEK